MKKKAAPHAKSKSKSAAKSSSKTSAKANLSVGRSAAELIDERIKQLGDWRGELLDKLRALIHAADPDVVEEWKWSVPVWSHDGIICTGETYKSVVKLTFARGASLNDPAGLFNSSLEGNTRRAIDFHEGAKVDEKGLKALIREAAKLNASTAAAAAPRKAAGKKATAEIAASGNAKSKGAAADQSAVAGKKPTTIAEYIKAAPAAGRAHLQRTYEILKSVAPKAEETIKWNAPFFIEPRFLFSFSACKAHMNFAPMQKALAPFRDELKHHRTTANFLQVPYNEPLPDDLIRRIAETSQEGGWCRNRSSDRKVERCRSTVSGWS